MTNDFAEVLYPRLPVFLQNLACSYIGWREGRVRFGRYFEQKLEELCASESWGAASIEAYQTEQLHGIICHAYANVPYYHDVMRERGLTPSDIRTREDLQKLPILTKEDVRKNFDRLVSTDAGKNDMIRRHTSGTTGKSLDFYSGKQAIAFQWAVWWRHRRRFGLELGDRHVNFTGKPVAPAMQQRPPYWRWNRPWNQALINMHHLTPEKIGAVVEFLNENEFSFYSGYPSIIDSLAVIAGEAGLTLANGPRLIVTGAENVLDRQRHAIESFTGAIVTDQYGSSEGCGNASQCENSLYHEDFEFGILECVDPVPVGAGRRHGRIICTGFASPEFPLIRYDVGDTATWERDGFRCSCGRESKALISIDGRQDDYVLTPEGRRIMRFDYVFKGTANVKESQVVQDCIGEVRIRLVPRPGYGSADRDLIRSEIRKWISPRLHVHFEEVNEIERERNGKFRAVKSTLSPRLAPAEPRSAIRTDLNISNRMMS